MFNATSNSTASGSSSTKNDSVSSLYTSLYVNASIGSVLLLLFCFIHRRRFLGIYAFYAPRKEGNDNALTVKFWTGLFVWIWESLSYPDKRLWRTHGADAITYVRFQRMCILSCLIMAILSCSILLPINLSGSMPNLSTLGQMTISHLNENDPKLAAHIVVTWLYSLFFYFFLFYYYRLFAQVRKSWLNRNLPRTYSIVLRNIPRKMQRKVAIQGWFEDHFRTEVVNVVLLWDDSKLLKLKDKRASHVNKLELAKLDCAQLKKRKETPYYCCGACGRKNRRKGKLCCCCCNILTSVTRPLLSCFRFGKRLLSHYCCCCCCTFYEKGGDRMLTHEGTLEVMGKKVDAVAHYRHKVEHLTQKIRTIQTNKHDKLKKNGVAFVTFKKVYPARVKISPYVTPQQMMVAPAPDPADLLWASFNVSFIFQIVRMVVITAIMAVVCLFWGFIAVAITSISNLKNLAQIGALSWIGDFIYIFPSQVQALIQGYLPPVLLFLFTMLMKPIIKFFYKRSGYLYSHSEVEWWTMSTYTVFLFFNVFLISTIGSTIFTVLSNFIDNPTSIVTLLATALPLQSEFFITYLMVAGVGRIPFKLFRLGDLITVVFRLIFTFPRTPRQRRTIRNLALWFDYAGEVSQGLLVLTLTLVFSVMAPLITPFGLFYFFMDYIITRYNLIYANLTPWDSGGKLWTKIYHHANSSVLVFQLVMVGIFGLNSSYQSGLWALIPLPVITIFYWVGIHFLWSPVSAFGPINGTCTIKQTFLDMSLLKKAYEQPSFTDPEEEIKEEEIEGYISEDEEKGIVKSDTSADEEEQEVQKEEEIEMAEMTSGYGSKLAVEEERGAGHQRQQPGSDETASRTNNSTGSKGSKKKGMGLSSRTRKGPTPEEIVALMQKINQEYDKRFERDIQEMKWQKQQQMKRNGTSRDQA